VVLVRRSPFAVRCGWRDTALATTLTPKLKSISALCAPAALQSMNILFSCEDFSEKSFASPINRARARRRARAREAIKPYSVLDSRNDSERRSNS